VTDLDLRDLHYGLPAITPAFGAALAEAGAVCLSQQGHQPGVALHVIGELTALLPLYWPPVTPRMLRCWNDREYTTEQAAYGIALLLLVKLTDYTVVERSRRGTGFDYWLGKAADSADSADLPFQKSMRLEVSGIRQGNPSQVRTRVKLKKMQVSPTDPLAPAFIVIVEFSQPLASITTS
jgi:hypothetical protein